MRRGDLMVVITRCSWGQQRVYEKGEVGVLLTEHPPRGMLSVVSLLVDGIPAEFVNMHVRLLQAAEEGR